MLEDLGHWHVFEDSAGVATALDMIVCVVGSMPDHAWLSLKSVDSMECGRYCRVRSVEAKNTQIAEKIRFDSHLASIRVSFLPFPYKQNPYTSYVWRTKRSSRSLSTHYFRLRTRVQTRTHTPQLIIADCPYKSVFAFHK